MRKLCDNCRGADRLKTICLKLKQVAETVICKKQPWWINLIELLAVKYLYIILALTVLDGKWYQGYGSYGISFSFPKEIIASLVFVPVCILYQKLKFNDGFSKVLMQCLFVLYYIPLNSAYALNNTSVQFFLLSNLYFVLFAAATWGLSFLLNCKSKKTTYPTAGILSNTQHNARLVNVFCLAFCILFIIHKLCYNGLSVPLTMDSGVIYTLRAEYDSYLAEISGTFFSYLLTLVRNPIIYVVTFFLLLSLIRKKPIYVMISLLSVFATYSVSASKSRLLMVVVVVGIYILYKTGLLKHFDRIFIYGMILLLLFCAAEHLLLDSDRIFTLIIRRQMYVPAWLNTLYYDFFSTGDKIYWTQNVFLLQKIFDPVYDLSPLELINNTYFQGTVPSPNTGMFAEAYMHFGVLGIFIYPVLLAILIVGSDRILGEYEYPIQLLMACQLTLSLTNVPCTRTDFVLSYVLFIAMLFIVPRLNLSYAKRIKEFLTRKKVRQQ